MAIVSSLGLLDLKLDLMPNKLFSFETTENILKELDSDVEIIGLFDDAVVSSGSEYKQVTDLLSLYAKSPRVTVRYIDPDRNPGIINQLDPDNTMNLRSTNFVVKSVVNGVEKKKKLDYYDLFQMEFDQYSFSQYIRFQCEQGFTGAIKYVTSVLPSFTSRKVMMKAWDSNTVISEYLEKNNILVKKINLMTVEQVPEDAELVVVASPRRDFSYSERDVLESYFHNGGKAIFMFDYLENDPSFEELNKLLNKFNLELNYDKVRETDESRHLPQDPYTLVVDVKSSSIVPRAFNTFLTNCRSISILKNEKQYITHTSLISTSDSAVGEMVNKSRGDDLPGPLELAVAVDLRAERSPRK